MRRTDQRRVAVFALYQHDLTGRPLEKTLEPDPPRYAKELATGVLEHSGDLDRAIEVHAKGWSLDRIAPLERAILRTAIYEMRERSDIPAEVAIDQAVELAKEFCGADAPGFVNGILGAVAREQPAS